MNFQTKQTDLSNDPLEVFASLEPDHEYCFLLETLADKYQPQTTGQSYIGIKPRHVYGAKEGKFYVDHKPQEAKNPYDALRERMDFDRSLPGGYVGGMVGYFSHEAIMYSEPTLKFPYEREFYDFEFADYQDGLIFRQNQAPEYFYYGEDKSDIYRGKAKKVNKLSIKPGPAMKDQKEYGRMIDKARDDIINGRVFQVVLANRFEYGIQGDLLELYKELRRINPSPFMFFLKFGNIVTLGASPELLAHTNSQNEVFLEALAGTIQRGKTPGEDEMYANKLLADEKETAEHSMLVDLARNDVGRISKVGSVEINDLMYIKKLSHVQHISSIVSGKLEQGKDAFDALPSSFPAGTLSGAPKIEAIKMIRELEGYERGPYGGTIGYFSYNGDSVHAVNIRSVNAIGNKLYLHSGSGIVYDSRVEREGEEIREKKAAMDKAMKPFLEGGEA
ncbi:MAG TPA: anthranilate synthase component I family protein [Candidatus Saccharimonadales bacterium]|nr:anthranilate synthase component I family protein [Candidatus Saccharimonadales bacterium]